MSQISLSNQALKSRWRNSVNQLSKLQEQGKMNIIDNNQKKINSLKLKMKNRLGQADPDFIPQSFPTKYTQETPKKFNNKLASTNHATTVQSQNDIFNKHRLQNSIIFQSEQNFNIQKNNPEQLKYSFDSQQSKCLVQELTEFNQNQYNNEMHQYKKSQFKNKSILSNFFQKEQSNLSIYCFSCDEKIIQNHKCLTPLNSLPRVDRALLKLKNQIQNENKRIFSIFMHNLTLEQHQLDQLINHVKILKTAYKLQYEPTQAIYRMRLMNLIGKKIGLILNITNQKQREDQSIIMPSCLKAKLS